MIKETLQEAAEINCISITHPYCDREKRMFIKGAKWQQEQDKNKYILEDIENIWNEFVKELPPINNGSSSDFLDYIQKFKNKEL